MTPSQPRTLDDPRRAASPPTAASAAARRRSAPSSSPRLAGDGAAVMGTSHRQKPVKALVGRDPRAACASCSSLPDGYEVVLGNGGTTAFWDAAAVRAGPRARAAPDLRRVLRRSSPTVTAGAPFLGDPIVVERRPRRRARRRAARRRTPTSSRWAHNETSTGVMVAGRAPGGDGDALVADRRHLGRRRPAGRRRARPTPTTSRRRSASPPTAACGSRC